jgi:hypothetical protein
VHASEDIAFLKKLTSSAIWLAGRNHRNNSFTWEDGSGEYMDSLLSNMRNDF